MEVRSFFGTESQRKQQGYGLGIVRATEFVSETDSVMRADDSQNLSFGDFNPGFYVFIITPPVGKMFFTSPGQVG